MNRKITRQSISVCLLAGGILALLLAGVWALEAQAQDESPVCPPGFEWQRMSGVGCVQSDCYDAGGRLSYTSACICAEGMKDCSEPVDYTNFDSDLCGIWCPGWRLTACVPQDALCPGEETPQREDPFYEEPSMDWEAPLFGGREFMEDFITGGHAHPPTPGRAAAAAVTGTVMISLWMFVQSLGQAPGQGAASFGKRGASDVRPQADQQVRQQARQPVGKVGLEAPDVIAPPEIPDLREAAGGMVTDVADVIDKWPGGGKGDEGATLLRKAEPDPGEEVFTGDDARLILIGMGRLPANTAQSERILVGADGTAAFSGKHASGQAQRIILASGREILVAEVTSVGYEGASPDQAGSVEIDFSRKLTLAARLVEDIFEAPTLKRIVVDETDAPTILRRDLEEDEDQDGEVHS